MKHLFTLLAFGFMAFGAVLFWIKVTTPDVRKIDKCMTTSMNKVFLCPGSKNYVSLKEISQNLIDAVIISEDAAFFDHSGFDWSELRLSFIQNISRGSFFRGGSTITQQLAKNVFLTSDKTITRKLREAGLAMKLEEFLTKDEILERYLNVVEFGENMYGVKSASQFYFEKTPSELNVLESIFLAYLLPNPKSYSKVYYDRELDEYAVKRHKDLLRKMALFKKITKEEQERWVLLLEQFPWEDSEDYPSFDTSHSPVGEDNTEEKENPDINKEDGLEVAQ